MSGPTPPPSETKVTIDGFEVTVPAGSTIIQAAQKIAKYIPHFCYHPGLTVVGQCRMCFVEIEGAPKLATACSQPVAEGMKIHTASPKVKAGQNSTLEFTLLNHPLDCPICDRGGECKLQDYTYEYGPPLSRMVDDKLVKDKHRPISEEVILDQERCILCTRCVRFSSEVDGRNELTVQNRGSSNVIDVFEGRPVSSPFSGNVVDICPVGALTAQDYRFAARPWELKRFSAVCTGCAVGCNVEIHTKNRHPGIVRPDKAPPVPEIVRLVPRDNLDVNTWWMCDKGRWGYHFHNDLPRLLTPQARRTKAGELEDVSLKEIQLLLEQNGAENGNTAPWEFWIDDSVPHEGIAWAKEILQSWVSRGRNVNPVLNPAPFATPFLKAFAERAPSPWTAGAAEWDEIRTVVSPYTYRELESRVPILSLRLGQLVRKGLLKWEVTPTNKIEAAKDLAQTAYLVDAPANAAELKALQALPSDAKLLYLFNECNARGLLNEGIAPLEVLREDLASRKPQGPVFYFGQRTQNPVRPELAHYLAQAPFVVVADSFASELSKIASVILPLSPLYETHSTLTNLENRRQSSAGVEINHPNYASIQRGNAFINPSLRLL